MSLNIVLRTTFRYWRLAGAGRFTQLMTILPYFIFCFTFPIWVYILLRFIDVNAFGWKSQIAALVIPGIVTSIFGYAILIMFSKPIQKDSSLRYACINWVFLDVCAAFSVVGVLYLALSAWS